jgi:riboflavin transporter FmnP
LRLIAEIEGFAVGWISVVVIIASLLAAAIYLVRKGVRRWWDYVVIAGLTAALVRPILMIATGDVSVWLPVGIWSDGFDGKDQIIVASAMTTVLLPFVLAAGAVCAVRRAIDFARADRVPS